MNAAAKAWYWVAAGMVSLGLNGYYQDGGMQWLHRAAQITWTSVAETRADVRGHLELAEVALASHARIHCPRHPAATQVAVTVPMDVQMQLAGLQQQLAMAESARVQARVAALQAGMARQELRQIEIQNGSLAVLAKDGEVRVAWPGVSVEVPQIPLVSPN